MVVQPVVSGEQTLLVCLEQAMPPALVQVWGEHEGEWSYVIGPDSPNPAQLVVLRITLSICQAQPYEQQM